MIHARIKELRLGSHLTMKELAEKLTLSESVISLYESGKRQPSYDILLKLSEIFNVSVDYLLGNDAPQKDNDLENALIATFGDARDYTEDELNEIKNFVKFIKSKRAEKDDSK